MNDLFGNPLPQSRYAGLQRTAEFSRCGRYRFTLGREWPDGEGTICFIMLNPSTATHEVDDPTIRRTMGFARRENFQWLIIRNLFAWRSTDPKGLLAIDDPVGRPRNDLEMMASMTADKVVVAWGGKVPFNRDGEVLAMLKAYGPGSEGTPLYCLGRTKSGAPRHPLYVKADQPLELFR